MKKSTSQHLTIKRDEDRSKQEIGKSTLRLRTGNSNNGASKASQRNLFTIPQHYRLFSKQPKKNRAEKKSLPIDEPKTICDIDETFFKIIEGRPLRQFSDIKVYMTNIRDITLFRANASYLKDEIIQINTAFLDELEEYNKIEKLYVSIKSSFVGFAKDSYQRAKRFEQMCKYREKLLDTINEKLNEYSFNFNKIRNEVDYLEAVFEILLKYGEFLFNISPVTWKHSRGNIFPNKSFGLLRTYSSDIYSPSIQCENKYSGIIKNLKSNEPELFFTKPAQIIRIFENLSQQCQNYMELDVLTFNIKKSVFTRRNHLRSIIVNESDEVRDIIDYYEKQISFLELKETEYQTKFYRVLSTEFHDLYASYEATKIFTCLQYVHTQAFATQEDPKDNIRTLAHNLENAYMEIMSKFDDLDQKVVKEATKVLFAEDRKMMKQALFAQRTLKECNILTKCLYTSFEPPRYRLK